MTLVCQWFTRTLQECDSSGLCSLQVFFENWEQIYWYWVCEVISFYFVVSECCFEKHMTHSSWLRESFVFFFAVCVCVCVCADTWKQIWDMNSQGICWAASHTWGEKWLRIIKDNWWCLNTWWCQVSEDIRTLQFILTQWAHLLQLWKKISTIYTWIIENINFINNTACFKGA